MSDERKRILEMLTGGKINVDEAERLLAALESNAASQPNDSVASGNEKKKPQFLHIKVEAGPNSSKRHENIDIKIPIMLLKAGVKLGSVVPEKTRGRFASYLSSKGLDTDLKQLGSEDIDTLIQALTESSIDIDDGGEKVRIFCA
jgi:hypothetical protein